MTHVSLENRSRKKRLALVFILTGVYLVAEVVGGLLTNSLALLADAGHMLTDVAGLGLALFAIKLAERPASSSMTYGYLRAEILAAVVNAVVLLGVSFYVLYEAVERFKNPPAIATLSMLLIGVLGLVVNVIGLLILRHDSKQNLNMRGAYFEVLSDAVTSIGVIMAAGVMWATGWYFVDAIVSAGIGLFIIPRTWNLLREAIGVLLEGAPAEIDIAALREQLNSIPGVSNVHDIHVWSLTSGVNALSAHVVMKNGSDQNGLLSTIHSSVKSSHKIGHVTIQLEAEGFAEGETHL